MVKVRVLEGAKDVCPLNIVDRLPIVLILWHRVSTRGGRQRNAIFRAEQVGGWRVSRRVDRPRGVGLVWVVEFGKVLWLDYVGLAVERGPFEGVL